MQEGACHPRASCSQSISKLNCVSVSDKAHLAHLPMFSTALWGHLCPLTSPNISGGECGNGHLGLLMVPMSGQSTCRGRPWVPSPAPRGPRAILEQKQNLLFRLRNCLLERREEFQRPAAIPQLPPTCPQGRGNQESQSLQDPQQQSPPGGRPHAQAPF